MSCANVTSLSSPQGPKAQQNLENLETLKPCDGDIYCPGGREEMNCGEYNYSIV